MAFRAPDQGRFVRLGQELSGPLHPRDEPGERAGGSRGRAQAGWSRVQVLFPGSPDVIMLLSPGWLAWLAWLAEGIWRMRSGGGWLPLLPGGGTRGGRWSEHRKVVDGVLFRVRTGVPWRDLPERFGPWEMVCKRHRRWSADGMWDLLLTRIQAAEDAGGRIGWDVFRRTPPRRGRISTWPAHGTARRLSGKPEPWSRTTTGGRIVEPGGRPVLAVAPVVADGFLVPVVGQVGVVADDHLEVRGERGDDLVHELGEAGDAHTVFVDGDFFQPPARFGHAGGVVGVGWLVEHEEAGNGPAVGDEVLVVGDVSRQVVSERLFRCPMGPGGAPVVELAGR